jgi:hypothetical protein
MAKGDHIYVTSFFGGIPYQHHGIDMGDETVIHLAAETARVTLRDDSGRFCVRRDSRQDFCRGGDPVIVRHADGLDAEQVAARAEELLGKPGYRLLDGNCEHFARYCATGQAVSHQIEMGQATLSAVASMSTKAFWSLSSKYGSRLAIKGATKVHPATLLADGVEIVALAIGCRSGLAADQAQRVARISGSLTALGVGVVVGGPAGAAACLATHSSSTAIANYFCKRVRNALA